MELQKLKLYCDGACSGNPGPGGCAFIILDESTKYDYREAKYFPNTTNNRMELQACIEGLEEIYVRGKNVNVIEIYTDSQYLVKTMTMGWKKSKNTDLWQDLDDVIEDLKRENPSNFKIEWNWVKGHASNKYNNLCDKMAVNAYKNPPLQQDQIIERVDTIDISFKHIQTYTYSNREVNIYEFKNEICNQYVAELDNAEIVGFANNLKNLHEIVESKIKKDLLNL